MQFFTAPEVCERFKVSRGTLQRWIKAGFFPAPVKIGPRTIRFRSVDLDAVGTCLPRETGASLTGWVIDPPDDVPAEQLVTDLNDDAASAGELAESQMEQIEQDLRARYPARKELLE